MTTTSEPLSTAFKLEWRHVVLCIAAVAFTWSLLFAAITPSLTLEPDPVWVMSKAAEYAIYANVVLWAAFVVAWAMELLWAGWRNVSRILHLPTAFMVVVGWVGGFVLFAGRTSAGLFEGGGLAIYMFFGEWVIGWLLFFVTVLATAAIAGVLAAWAMRARRWGLVAWVLVLLGISAGASKFAIDEAHGPRLLLRPEPPGDDETIQNAPSEASGKLRSEPLW